MPNYPSAGNSANFYIYFIRQNLRVLPVDKNYIVVYTLFKYRQKEI